MQASRLTLMCHARTLAQKLGRFALDEPVEMDWQAHRASLASRFVRVPRVLSAPELRTRQSAELLGADFEIVPALRDCDFGRWQGLRLGQLQKDEPEALLDWLSDPGSAPHGGESVLELGQRVAVWLETLSAGSGHVVAVTHPFVIRAAMMQVMQCPPAAFNLIDVEPLSMLELSFYGRWRLRLAARE